MGDSRKQDSSYFAELVGSFNDGKTLSGFVNHLLNDPTELDVRTKPRTKEHVDQKIKSLEGFERYWYEVCLQVISVVQIEMVIFMNVTDLFLKQIVL